MTGVQTCALPILMDEERESSAFQSPNQMHSSHVGRNGNNRGYCINNKLPCAGG